MEELIRLSEITRRLREPGGCDWDRAQNFESVRAHLLEEAWEVIHAVDKGDFDNLKEELGDLLFVVYFYARIAEEENHFTLEDAAKGVCEKLIRRHPHVFGDTRVEGVGDILRNWEEIKKTEGGENGNSAPENGNHKSIFEKRLDFLPALLEAEKIQAKASRIGFDWKLPDGVIQKIQEEIGELEKELKEKQKSDKNIEEELGDILFSVVNLSRHLNVNPELSLRKASKKFVSRFQEMEKLSLKENKAIGEFSPEELEELWEEVKIREKK